MKTVLGFIAAAFIFAIAKLGGAVVGRTAVEEFNRATFSQAELEKALNEQTPKTFAVMKDNFPVEYQALLQELMSIVKSSGTGADAKVKAQSAVRAVRVKYAKYVNAAPDVSLRSLLLSYKKMLSKLYIEESWQVCNEFAAKGPLGLSSDVLARYWPEIDDTAAKSFEAMAQGSSNPAGGPALPLEDDWFFVFAELLEVGVTLEHIEALETFDVADPALCPTTIALFQSLAASNGEAALRIRASFAAGLVAS